MKPQGTLALTTFPRRVEIRGRLDTRPLRLYLQDEDGVHLITKDQTKIAIVIADGVEHPRQERDTGTSPTMLIGSCKGDASILIDGRHVLTEHALGHLTDGAIHSINERVERILERLDRSSHPARRRWMDSLKDPDLLDIPDVSDGQLLAEAIVCVAMALSRVTFPEDDEQAGLLARAGAVTVDVRRRLDPGHVSRRAYDVHATHMSRDDRLRELIDRLLDVCRDLDPTYQRPRPRGDLDPWPVDKQLRHVEAGLRTVWKLDHGVPLGARDPEDVL